jgi:hypothetical protein
VREKEKGKITPLLSSSPETILISVAALTNYNKLEA